MNIILLSSTVGHSHSCIIERLIDRSFNNYSSITIRDLYKFIRTYQEIVRSTQQVRLWRHDTCSAKAFAFTVRLLIGNIITKPTTLISCRYALSTINGRSNMSFRNWRDHETWLVKPSVNRRTRSADIREHCYTFRKCAGPSGVSWL